jgi:hypothetical protein
VPQAQRDFITRKLILDQKFADFDSCRVQPHYQRFMEIPVRTDHFDRLSQKLIPAQTVASGTTHFTPHLTAKARL